MKTLTDLGERQLLRWIQEQFPQSKDEVVNIGDDCSVLRLPGTKQVLVTTIDASPKPLCMAFGYKNFSIYGWYSVIVNLSDIASMGAKSLGILLSLTASKSLSFDDFRDFFSGVKDACAHYKCPLLGGNLNDGDDFSVHGNAFGLVNRYGIMLRNNARIGDAVLVAGNLGVFWASIIALQKKCRLSPSQKSLLERALCRPQPQIRIARRLSLLGYSKCAMDVTDGLTPSLLEIASRSKVDICVSFDSVTIHPFTQWVADREEIDPLRIIRGWGDWLLLFTAKENALTKIRHLAKRLSVPVSRIGTVVAGNGRVYTKINNTKKIIKNIDAERFTGSSYSINSYKSYLTNLLETELFD